MKTNKFENTIRRKLESIEPDFQEQDWARMQKYMQAHTPPTFLQQYGSWIGYAAAASVTSVMAYLYVNQLSQNDRLVAGMKSLESQIEVIRNQPAPIAKTDTVYILQQTPGAGTYAARPLTSGQHRFEYSGEAATATGEEGALDYSAGKLHDNVAANRNTSAADRTAQANLPSEMPEASRSEAPTQSNSTRITPQDNLKGIASTSSAADANGNIPAPQADGAQKNDPILAKTFDSNFGIAEITRVSETNPGYVLKRKMNYELVSKLSNRQVQRALTANHIQIAKTPASGKKAEQVAQAENVIPKLNLKVPYRFGGGYQVENNGQGKTIQGEVIVNKKFSIAAGITWLKVKPAEFFSEKIFREKNSRDFKATHPGEVPLIFDLYNIKIAQTVVQMPLTLAFRNTLKNDWAYYASMGANVKLSSKETISYDCRGPRNEFFNQKFSKKGDVPPVTSMNFGLGIEKSWHPIVVQVEGYWVNYFKPVTPFTRTAGPGVKVKLLYQIGRQM